MIQAKGILSRKLEKPDGDAPKPRDITFAKHVVPSFHKTPYLWNTVTLNLIKCYAQFFNRM